MSRGGRPSDPRRAGGSIAGPGGPYERHGVVIDTTNAVLLDGTQVALVEAIRGGESELSFAVELQGRINKTDERSQVVYMTNADGIAGLVTELLAVATRAGRPIQDEVLQRLAERWKDVPR